MRYAMYNRQMDFVEQLEQEGKIVVVRPSEYVRIARIEKNATRLQAMYDLGIKDAQRQLLTIKKHFE